MTLNQYRKARLEQRRLQVMKQRIADYFSRQGGVEFPPIVAALLQMAAEAAQEEPSTRH